MTHSIGDAAVAIYFSDKSDQSDKKFLGSGFVCSENLVLTAWHVVKKRVDTPRNIFITEFHGDRNNIFVAVDAVIPCSKPEHAYYDIALLSFDRKKLNVDPCIAPINVDIASGQDIKSGAVHAYWNDKTAPNGITFGKVPIDSNSEIYHDSNRRAYRVNADFRPCNSGGLVHDGRSAIGVVSSREAHETRYCYFVPLCFNDIRSWLKDNGVDVEDEKTDALKDSGVDSEDEKPDAPELDDILTLVSVAREAFEKVLANGLFISEPAVEGLCKALNGEKPLLPKGAAEVLFPDTMQKLQPQASLGKLQKACAEIFNEAGYSDSSKRAAFDVAQVALCWLLVMAVDENYLKAQGLNASKVLSRVNRLVSETQVGAWAIRARLYNKALEMSEILVDNGQLSYDYEVVAKPITQGIYYRDKQIHLLREILLQLLGEKEHGLPIDLVALEKRLKEHFRQALELDEPYLITLHTDQVNFMGTYLADLAHNWKNFMVVEICPDGAGQVVFSMENESGLTTYLVRFLEWKAKLNDNT